MPRGAASARPVSGTTCPGGRRRGADEYVVGAVGRRSRPASRPVARYARPNKAPVARCAQARRPRRPDVGGGEEHGAHGEGLRVRRADGRATESERAPDRFLLDGLRGQHEAAGEKPLARQGGERRCGDPAPREQDEGGGSEQAAERSGLAGGNGASDRADDGRARRAPRAAPTASQAARRRAAATPSFTPVPERDEVEDAS